MQIPIRLGPFAKIQKSLLHFWRNALTRNVNTTAETKLIENRKGKISTEENPIHKRWMDIQAEVLQLNMDQWTMAHEMDTVGLTDQSPPPKKSNARLQSPKQGLFIE